MNKHTIQASVTITCVINALLAVILISCWLFGVPSYTSLCDMIISRSYLLLHTLTLLIIYIIVIKNINIERRTCVHAIVLAVSAFSLFLFIPYIPISYMKWYPEKIKAMESRKVGADQFLTGKYLDDGSIEYEVFDEGAIRFNDGNWVFIITRVMERDQIKMRDVVDFSLAVDAKGNVYSLNDTKGVNLVINSKTNGLIPDLKYFLDLNEWVLVKR